MCGEQHKKPLDRITTAGSPPRVRGTGVIRSLDEAGGRITPACAGNREGILSWTNDGEDHPRVCGEQISSALRIGARVGSPPRVRGTDQEISSGIDTERITPACAGNSTR